MINAANTRNGGRVCDIAFIPKTVGTVNKLYWPCRSRLFSIVYTTSDKSSMESFVQ